MALTKDRSGRIHGPLYTQQDFDLSADGEVFRGGLYRVVDGMLATPEDSAVQARCITVMALEWKSNPGGQDRGRRARCMVDGIAIVPAGELPAAAIGKPVYPTDNDAVSASAPTAAENQPAGTLLAVERSHIKIKLG